MNGSWDLDDMLRPQGRVTVRRLAHPQAREVLAAIAAQIELVEATAAETPPARRAEDLRRAEVLARAYEVVWQALEAQHSRRLDRRRGGRVTYTEDVPVAGDRL